MADGPVEIPRELLDELKKKATPAHLAQYVTKDLPYEAAWRPFDHLLYVNDLLVDAVTSPEQTFLNIAISVRHGKQTRLDEPVLTAAGWSTIGELKEGDRVFGPAGDQRKVVALGPIDPMSPKMRVLFTDGTHVDVHPEHEWTLTVGGRTNTFETQELARRTLGSEAIGQWRYKLPTRGPLMGQAAHLPLGPYMLGVWLGDGKTSGPTLSLGPQDADTILAGVAAEGYEPSSRWTQAETDVRYAYFPLMDELRAAGVLGLKHIPDPYFVAEIADRRSLLQGLVDTDGHVEAGSGRVRYVSHDERLARDVCALARTLGHRATVYTEVDERDPHEITFRTGETHLIATAGTRYVASWTPHDGQPQGRLPRKQVLRSRKPDRVAIRSITPAPAADGMCIQVDAEDGLFLVGRDLIPTHNSELISRYLPVWFLGMFPERQVIIVSYNESKAGEWGAFTRDVMKEWGPELFGLHVDTETASKTEWKLKGHRGGLRAVGINGSLTGIGGDLIIIDDPLKNREEADSQAARDAMFSWYGSTLRTRMMPGGTMILTMARWHEDDLTGKIEKKSKEEPGGDQWRNVALPALAEAPKWHPPLVPTEDWRDELGRADGDALWPEVWPKKALEQIQKSIDRADWESLYQQNPTSREGGMFKVADWRYRSDVPQGITSLRLARVWDLAATEGGGDWTVGTLMGLGNDNTVYVLERQRFQRDSNGVKKEILRCAREDGRGVPIGVEQERAGAGKAQVQDIKRMLVGYTVVAMKPEGTKEQRAAPYASQQQDHNVTLIGPKEEWASFVEEHRVFPKGRHDDQVDSASGAFLLLADSSPTEITEPSDVEEVDLGAMISSAFGGVEREWSIPVG